MNVSPLAQSLPALSCAFFHMITDQIRSRVSVGPFDPFGPLPPAAAVLQWPLRGWGAGRW